MADPAVPQLLTDAQLAAVIGLLSAAVTAVGAGIRWAVNRLVRAQDRNTAAHAKSVSDIIDVYRQMADSQVEHAKAMTELAVKVERVADWVEEHTPITARDRPTGPTPRGGYGPMTPTK